MPTMRTTEYYPYTGGQIQAYKHERGKLAWSDFYDDFDMVSGEYGFFIDFRLEAPPPRQDNEIRIVLTGGSTAQGWGGRTNADMFYQLLPTKLNQELQEHGQNCKVTVINLAMASSQIYQNFIALSKWAHPLRPDAIVSFSGANETAVPWTSKGDADQLASYQVGGFLHVPRYSASPRWLKILAEDVRNRKADGARVTDPIHVPARLQRRLGRQLFSEQGGPELSADASGRAAAAL